MCLIPVCHSATSHSGSSLDWQQIATRPIHQLVGGLDRKLDALSKSDVNIVVVGAGAAGIEVAFTVGVKCQKRGKTPSVTLIDSREELLGGAA